MQEINIEGLCPKCFERYTFCSNTFECLKHKCWMINWLKNENEKLHEEIEKLKLEISEK